MGEKISLRKAPKGQAKSKGYVYGDSRAHLLNTLGGEVREESLPFLDPKIIKQFRKKTDMDKLIRGFQDSVINNSFENQSLLRTHTDPNEEGSLIFTRNAEEPSERKRVMYGESLNRSKSKWSKSPTDNRHVLKKISSRTLTLREYEMIQMNQHSQNILQEKLRRRRVKNHRWKEKFPMSEQTLSKSDSKKDITSMLLGPGGRLPERSADIRLKEFDLLETKSLSKQTYYGGKEPRLPGIHVHSYSIDYKVIESIVSEGNDVNASTNTKSYAEEYTKKQSKFDGKLVQRSAREQVRTDLRPRVNGYPRNIKTRHSKGERDFNPSNYISDYVQNLNTSSKGSGSIKKPVLNERTVRKLTENRLNTKSMERDFFMSGEAEQDIGKILHSKIYSICASNEPEEVRKSLFKNIGVTQPSEPMAVQFSEGQHYSHHTKQY